MKEVNIIHKLRTEWSWLNESTTPLMFTAALLCRKNEASIMQKTMNMDQCVLYCWIGGTNSERKRKKSTSYNMTCKKYQIKYGACAIYFCC